MCTSLRGQSGREEYPDIKHDVASPVFLLCTPKQAENTHHMNVRWIQAEKCLMMITMFSTLFEFEPSLIPRSFPPAVHTEI